MKSVKNPFHLEKKPLKEQTTWLLVGAILLALSVFSLTSVKKLKSENNILSEEIEVLSGSLIASEDKLAMAQKDIEDLNHVLAETNQDLVSKEKQVSKISKKVDTLTKLTETDPELLIKYSKIYFLNENYTPRELTQIDTKYLFVKNKPLEILDEVDPYLSDLLADAESDGVQLQILSAYRSFGTQEALKSTYKVVYGAGTANQFSADQGYSEHQLGTTVDFTTPAMGGALTIAFDSTAAFKWLKDNAYKYGFILSYPKGNAYYQYEPWHWRFVGKSLARKLHSDNMNFYDLDQREIDKYLVRIFD